MNKPIEICKKNPLERKRICLFDDKIYFILNFYTKLKHRLEDSTSNIVQIFLK